MASAKNESSATKRASNDSARMTVSVETAAQILGISRGAGYAAARSGQIPTIKIGKRVLVSRAWIEKVLAV